METMLNRKIICKQQNTKIEEFIHQLQQNPANLSHPIIQTVLNSQELTLYFHNLASIINRKNMVIAKRYAVLEDGLYILLKGQISYMFCDQLGQRKAFVNESRNNMTNKTTAPSFRSILSQQLTVFQSERNNCTALQDSYLLKISQEQAASSNFNELLSRRKELYQNHYLPYDHQNIYNTDLINNIFTVDIKIHSNFRFKTYSLRQIIMPKSVGIISKGRAKLKIQHHPSPQFEKYGLILPSLSYQVTSSEFQMMLIQNNQTLRYKIDIAGPIFKSSAFQLTTHKSCSQSIHNRKNRPFLQLNHCESGYTTKEREKRQKQLIRITRQTEVYSIISSFLCHKSLEFAKKQNNKNLFKEKKDQKCKNPLILFKIPNIKSKIFTPSFADRSNISIANTPKRQRSSLCKTAPENADDFKRIKPNAFEGQKLIKRHNTKIFNTPPTRQQNKTKSMFTINLHRKISELTANHQKGLQTIIEN